VTARLVIEFAANEGALLRILGLMERRGYRVRELEMKEEQPHSSLSILLEARDSSRRPDVLARQIGNLFDVRSVDLFTPDKTVPA
jgi:acetolactate synthase regulatory subunit